jgi:glutamine synthetase
MAAGFIEKHGLLTEEQTASVEEVKQQVEAEGVRLVRMVWADSHGHARAKLVSVPVFLTALSEGYSINVATFTLDASGGRVFRSFVRGGGMDLEEMTGSPNLTIVPDPASFRILPWAPDIGWVLCNEYFTDGTPFHFSGRQILQKQLGRLAEKNLDLMVGLEVEWYLRRTGEDYIEYNTGMPGKRGRAIETLPVEPGYSYHSETNMDLIQPLLSTLAETYEKLGLPLRSIENEYAPGQLECTFAAQPAQLAADNFVLFRTATRQVCRRHGYFASFMCKPAIEGYYTSGWHLHQSLVDRESGANRCMPETDADCLSPLANAHLAGLLNHAQAAAVFATPTINGYQRFKPNSLAPDRATWSYDHRGAMLRVLGGIGDPATRIENRIGEPAANPYLFMASQIVAGLDGMEKNAKPWPADDEPYEADRPLLPATLGDALDALDNSALFREQFGDIYIDYYIALKQAELARYTAYIADNNADDGGNGVSQWEQDEYFDFF